jgi:uncharacterized protein
MDFRKAVSGFDWDSGNREKCRKHGVSLFEIEEMFSLQPSVSPDVRHSESEKRFLAIGKTHAGRAIFVAFTFRENVNTVLIRPISARYMHQKEVLAYEKAFARVE